MYEDIKRIVYSSENIVFFGGAGVSVASGIPDFRGSSGIYHGNDGSSEPPELILSFDYMIGRPERFFSYYKQKMIYPEAEPNAAHYALAALECEGRLSAVITQNIDGLHQAAGSKNVIELHGSTHRNYCMRCGRRYFQSDIVASYGVPRCECGGIIRPDVVLYGEALDSAAMYNAEEAICAADLLIVGGTSLTVQPAASLVAEFEGDNMIIINASPTPYDFLAAHVIREPIADVLSEIVK